MTVIDDMNRVGREICQEVCAFKGEPPCWKIDESAGKTWPGPCEACEPAAAYHLAAIRAYEDAGAKGAVVAPETGGPYEARVCKDIPTSCCDYGVISLSEGIEVCRVWKEQDARAIAAALASPPAAPALVRELQAKIDRLNEKASAFEDSYNSLWASWRSAVDRIKEYESEAALTRARKAGYGEAG